MFDSIDDNERRAFVCCDHVSAAAAGLDLCFSNCSNCNGSAGIEGGIQMVHDQHNTSFTLNIDSYMMVQTNDTRKTMSQFNEIQN